MGRKRKDDSLRLPLRTYVRAGTFYYAHRDTGKWENLGKDHAAACRRADHYNDPTGTYGTMSWFFDQFIINCEQRQAAGDMAKRTVDDYRGALGYLKPYFGHMLPTAIGPHHVTDYLDIGLKTGRPVRANREKAALSSCLSWMLRNNYGSLKVNPCLQASGVVRNEESPRERYVTHDEYREVWEVATRGERLLMELTYRTLQRPESDIILWTTENLVQEGERRVLAFRQNKTKRVLRVALTDNLEVLLPKGGNVVHLHAKPEPLLHTRTGGFYRYDSLYTMLQRSIATANVRRKARGVAEMERFGFRDLKGKGATDMWLAGEPIERIQALCGHAKASTTEIYIKARWRETVEPNAQKIVGTPRSISSK